MSQSDAYCVTLQGVSSLLNPDFTKFMKKKKRKIDHEALQSSFMQIPQMKADIARGLLDAGFSEGYELSGRAPEVIIEQIQQLNSDLKTMPDLSERIQVAVYFMENHDHEPAKLKLSYWTTHN